MSLNLFRGRSFDQYGRYSPVSQVRRALPAERLRVLDVGDPAGLIGLLFPDDATVSLDLFAAAEPQAAGHARVMGSGFELPFADDTFDLVASHDAFEHLPAERRTHFVDELLRVSRGPVVLVAPFNDPRTVLCEELVNAYFVSRLGTPIDALEEHAMFGLPDVEHLVAHLAGRGVPHRVFGDGWLYHWIAFYFLRAHLDADGDGPRVRQADAVFNEFLVAQDHAAPHYRRIVIMNAEAALAFVPPTDPGPYESEDERLLTDLAAQLGRLLAPGEQPWPPGSRLRAWLRDDAHDGGPLAVAAQSLTIVLDGLQEGRAPGDAHGPASLVRPTTATFVLDTTANDDRSLLEQVNEFAETSDAECIAFVAADAVIDDGFVDALVDAYDPSAGYACVAGRLLNEADDEATFSMSVFGRPAVSWTTSSDGDADGPDVLFAPPQAMLIDRQAFLGAGGFDTACDLMSAAADLGWRLWVTGGRVRRAPRAVARLRGAVPMTGAGALRLVIKNYDDENLARVLGPALLLHPGAVGDLDNLLAARVAIQGARRRGDAAVVALFDRPFATAGDDAGVSELQHRVISAFGLDAVFASQRGLRVLVVFDPAGRAPLDRAGVFADALRRAADVAVAAPKGASPEGWDGPIRTFGDGQDLASMLDGVDVVIAPAGTVAANPEIAGTDAIVIVDLAGFGVDLDARRAGEVFLRGDFFVCASDRERDYWFGVIAGQGMAGRLHPDDPESRELLGVVPLGGREVTGALQAVVAEPWRWRNRARKRLSTEDLQLLIVKRDREISGLRDELHEAERRHNDDVKNLEEEIDRLRVLAHELQRALPVWRERWPWLRRLPGFAVARRVRRRWISPDQDS